jgi:hypothetical protein
VLIFGKCLFLISESGSGGRIRTYDMAVNRHGAHRSE